MTPPPFAAADVIALRESLTMDQPQFGQLLGVSERTVRGWEGGATIPASAQFTLALVRHCTHVAESTPDAMIVHYPATCDAAAFPFSRIDGTGAQALFRTWLRDLQVLLGRSDHGD